MENTATAKLAYSMEETMQALGFSRATLYEEINANRLRTYKVRKRRYCTHQALLDYQREREAEVATG